MKLQGAKGSIDWRTEPIHRVSRPVGHRRPRAAARVAVAAEPGRFSPGLKPENWTTSIVMSDEDAQRYVDNFESLAAATAG